ncbi:hypothetical protein ILUMI_20413 [Ignelater luminosus]|uniref:Uncharacterized protein n=1 Tax=Ignelater luminosus TaxID=2038154 RepID=A0A8K0G4W9_IGNLU|nr:hypothetical protein ILUMI_20413 [Ignelater luminosus]
MGGLGVKRRFPLMINESPIKKQKPNSSDGPTIHELDSAEVLPEELFGEEAEVQEPVQVESPASTSQQSQSLLLNDMDEIQTIEPEILLEASPLEMDKPSSVSVDALLTDPGTSEEAANISNLEVEDEFENEEPVLIDTDDSDKVFLNPSTQDTLLTNLLNGSYNGSLLNGSRNMSALKKDSSSDSNTLPDMTVATRDPNLAVTRLNSGGAEEPYSISEHMDTHIGNTQNELDQLKEFFHGCNGIDTTYLLNLFNDIPPYGLTPNQGRDEALENDLLSGSELAPYDSSKVDFNELFDDSTDLTDIVKPEPIFGINPDESLNTPEASNLKPFPWDKATNKK